MAMLVNALVSALVNVLVLAGVPFLGYVLYHKWRHKRRFRQIAQRAGLQFGERRYLGYSLIFATLAVIALLVLPLPVEPFTRKGSPQFPFVGLGITMPAIAMALTYGVIKTGFAEESLFRGLIAGSLGRRMPLLWANLLQALIFLSPHLLVLRLMPELWPVLPVVFLTALIKGWLRIRSGSILGPWLMHAAANVTTCLMVAARTSV